jgi:hypothetical protein
MTCPACAAKRLHTPEDWAQHPLAGHGFNGTLWTHPDLANGTQAGAATSPASGEVYAEQAAPAGGKL